ncbi:MAG TPA: phosphatidylserine decarboxylase family protein [Saprospiraceae bacterium]|nr:phosphatidylserine decarboxylase family protein [Saprospiraceae bacterium]
MKIHKEGTATLLAGFVICVALVGLTNIFYPSWMIVSLVVAIFIMSILLQFFRHPNRKFQPTEENMVIAPADGKVVVIEEVFEKEFFKAKRIQVSIFMSPMNVHVNRNPVTGSIVYNKYHPGKYLVAWHPKSSEENERTSIVYEMLNNQQLLMRQIAGAMARRIINYLSEGSVVTKGNEMGFIKFGSRVDLFFPLDSEIKVEIGSKVKGGISLIGIVPDLPK